MDSKSFVSAYRKGEIDNVVEAMIALSPQVGEKVIATIEKVDLKIYKGVLHSHFSAKGIVAASTFYAKSLSSLSPAERGQLFASLLADYKRAEDFTGLVALFEEEIQPTPKAVGIYLYALFQLNKGEKAIAFVEKMPSSPSETVYGVILDYFGRSSEHKSFVTWFRKMESDKIPIEIISLNRYIHALVELGYLKEALKEFEDRLFPLHKEALFADSKKQSISEGKGEVTINPHLLSHGAAFILVLRVLRDHPKVGWFTVIPGWGKNRKSRQKIGEMRSYLKAKLERYTPKVRYFPKKDNPGMFTLKKPLPWSFSLPTSKER